MTYKTRLSNRDNQKIESDLSFLRKLLRFSKTHNFRLVVSGGYGLDGILNTITRPHNDLDVIIYSQTSRNKITVLLTQFFKKTFSKVDISIKENKFLVDIDINTDGFDGNFYLVETINDSQNDVNAIKLANGETQINSKQRFPIPVLAKLNGIKFESQDPNLHLADILYKRKKNKQSKHSQDIKNLKSITKTDVVKSILAQY